MANLARKQEITIQPNPLYASGQQVEFDLKAQIPSKLYHDKQLYKLDVYYEYGTYEREDVATLNFNFGEFIYEDKKPTIIRHLAFPYAPEKDKGRLMVQGLIVDKRNDNIKVMQPMEVATGLITTPLLVTRNNKTDYLPDNFTEIADGPAVVPFYFGKEDSKPSKSLGSSLVILDKYALDNIKSQQIIVEGSQSPDEEAEGVASVADKRARAIEAFYLQRVKTLDYNNKKIRVQRKVLKTNWNLLLQKVKASALPQAEIQQVINIINSNQEEKEKALQQTAAYEYLQQYIYPALRFTKVVFNYNRDRKADYEIYVLAKKIAEEKIEASMLTEDELQYAATLTPLLAEKRKLYEAAVKTTDKWPAYYNLGTVYIEMARKEYRAPAKQALLARAIHNLTFAGFRNPTAEVYYSLASAYHLRSDKLEALQYYDYAIKLGGSKEILHRIFADKAALEIEIGQYDDAIKSLRYAGDSYQTTINLGLSYLLKDNYEGAEEYYKKALKQKPGGVLAHYSLALIGARTGNEQQLEEQLRLAVRADGSYMERAINDLEFAPYKGKPSFEDALSR
ncbi:tetratricopeptide repeat protein [Pontibacter silvestris]|uniref:Tetratricopeptide repeat protein n=2 Tax=Pontibacter silvestris TaxID=2305183 RepID=A0ABW4WTP1_9BACT|nr:tetratricopeptide repeat protein [Pontibacter silvestris]MCC9137776.1 tetratricopeptide repeat protein [Pontibacter silvestris]